MADIRPTEPILDGDLKEPKTFYHNAAYKTSRVAINLEKMKVRAWPAAPVQLERLRARCAGARARVLRTATALREPLPRVLGRAALVQERHLCAVIARCVRGQWRVSG